MANQVQARGGAVVFDPFVGTGSILIACAHFGALCLGSDIDWLVLHGKTKGATHNVMDNFRQYQLPMPGTTRPPSPSHTPPTHPPTYAVLCFVKQN
jgi:tRNA (guanine10-N2)-methyltransferase